jgi:hypothetical protein
MLMALSSQLYERLLSRLHRPRSTDQAPAQRKGSGHFERPARRAAAMTGPRTFNFLNVLTRLEWPAGWNTPDWGKPVALQSPLF